MVSKVPQAAENFIGHFRQRNQTQHCQYRPPLCKHLQEASKELKYQIHFADPFPDAVKQDSLPRQVYSCGIEATIKSGAFKGAEVRSRAAATFDGEWFSSVCQRLPSVWLHLTLSM